jgi:hypothetical protein
MKTVYDSLFVCYSWEMALHVDLNAPLDNMQGGKGIMEKAGQLVVRTII